MELQKAQRLLHKIQALLEPNSGHDLSRLEKDLLKSYIVQLYDAIQDESLILPEQPVKTKEIVVPARTETPKPPVQEKEPEKEIPTLIVPEIKVQKPVEVPVEINFTQQETIMAQTKVEPKIIHSPVYEPVHEPVKEQMREPVKETIKEPVKESVSKPYVHTLEKDQTGDEALKKLFEQRGDDMSERFSQVPIASIEAAMGLNERIFTLNELFGGDKSLFDSTCAKLNQFRSFSEAQQLLMNGPARDFKWGDKERLKMAEQFLRIVSRRYPKS